MTILFVLIHMGGTGEEEEALIPWMRRRAENWQPAVPVVHLSYVLACSSESRDFLGWGNSAHVSVEEWPVAASGSTYCKRILHTPGRLYLFT